ncbi:MAG: ATP-grasp domain-containing protein [Candidatus Odinarchaeota archaeon]
MKSILLGEISSYKAIVIAQYVKKNYSNIYIVGYDYKPLVRVFYTRYCDKIYIIENPSLQKSAHIKSISTIIKNNGINAFIPVDSAMYEDYIKEKKQFNDALSYIGDVDVYKQLHNKLLSQNLAHYLSIRTPKIYDNIKEARIPFIVKPTNLSSSKGIKYILSKHDKKKSIFFDKLDFVIQEYVRGIGCGYSVFAVNGNIICGHGHIRLAELPISGGSSMYRDNYHNQEMIQIAEKLLKATKWSGFAMFEFKLTPENELVFIEVNPRIWGSINQGLQNGVNYFEFLLGKIDKQVQIESIRTYLSPGIYFSLFAYMLKSNFIPIYKYFRNIRSNRVDVNLFTDFKGYMSMLLRKIT